MQEYHLKKSLHISMLQVFSFDLLMVFFAKDLKQTRKHMNGVKAFNPIKSFYACLISLCVLVNLIIIFVFILWLKIINEQKKEVKETHS